MRNNKIRAALEWLHGSICGMNLVFCMWMGEMAGLRPACRLFTVPSVGRLVGGWEVKGRALPAVTSLVLAVVLATAAVVMG